MSKFPTKLHSFLKLNSFLELNFVVKRFSIFAENCSGIIHFAYGMSPHFKEALLDLTCSLVLLNLSYKSIVVMFFCRVKSIG